VANVLLVSHTGRGSGFGRVAAGIAACLVLEFETHVVGLGPSQAGEAWLGHTHDPLDPTKTFGLRALATALKPAVILLVGVGKVAAWQATELRGDGFGGQLVAYVPVEGRIDNPWPLAGLRHCSAVMAYTHTGAAALRQALAAAAPAHLLPRIGVIPHAIDRLPQHTAPRPALRRELFPAFTQQAEHTWLLNANRHDDRKRPELTVRAFAQVVAEYPRTTLVMHCAPRRPGLDLQVLCSQLGLRERVIFSRPSEQMPWSEQALAKLYACCEIGVNNALGEGWGLVAFEHACQGGAQIMPTHAGLLEIWGDAPRWVPAGETHYIDNVFTGQVPAVADLAQALADLVGQPAHMAQVAAACGQYAHRASFGWEAVGAAWRALLCASTNAPPASQ